ncbi:hypothetical protein FJT64_001908 [Amphibalanus amphitrite]|uniref:Uncharacterized protein n=1 Tax=Amphibalanus amphitrite TaxID=1232801 RepID=A0A6A4WXV1_AMPAM|nr:hypothetical protein FJT64_001908 [Amphibalanus amphitrite]
MGYNRRVSQFISSLRIGPITSYVLVAAVVMTLSLHLLKERKIYSVSGDLLASPMQGLLFYEPFWYFRRGQGHKPIIKDIIDPEADKYVPKDLRKLLLCHQKLKLKKSVKPNFIL